MAVFKVTVHGRGLWISIDDERQRVQFHVTRILHARNADEAAQLALELVRQDPRAQPQPDSALPRLTVVAVARAATIPRTQPGFAFFPDPGSPS